MLIVYVLLREDEMILNFDWLIIIMWYFSVVHFEQELEMSFLKYFAVQISFEIDWEVF